MSPDRKSLDGLQIDRAREHRGPRLGWVIAGLLVMAAAAVLVVFAARPGPAAVRTAPVAETRMAAGQRTVLNASGYVTARRQATVSSKVTGKVVEVLIEEGMSVKEGDVLARLDNVNVRAGLSVAGARLGASRKALEETRVRLEKAFIDLSRAKELVAAKVSFQADLDAAQAEVKALEARLTQQKEEITVAEMEVALYKQDLEDMVIRAPFSGVVVTKAAQPGEMISPVSAGGGFTRTGIGTLVDMSSLEIEVDVNESYITRVVPGQPVEAVVDAYPDWRIPAHVIAIIPTADRQKATVKVRIGFDALDPRILPDMGVKVAFKAAGDQGTVEKPVLTIPRSAVRRDGSRDTVFVLKNGAVERRAVKVEQAPDGDLVVQSGLSSGERIVIEGPADLADGKKVKEVAP